MNNLRIIYDNAIARATTLTADTTAGSMSVSSLLTDIKSDVHRSTQKSVVYKARWPVAELLGGVFLVNGNYSDTATMRLRLTKEAVATNVVPYSNSIVANWSNNGSSGYTANAGIAPDGTTTSTLSVTGGSKFINLGTPAAGTFTASLFVRLNGTGTNHRLYVDGVGVTSPAVANFDVSTGALISMTGAAISYSSQAFPSGWWRLQMQFTTNGTGSINFHCFPTNGTGTEVWGAQVESGSSATSYYPTTGASAARPLGYIDSWQSYFYDSGVLIACPGGGVNIRNWANTPAGANAYAYGGGATARHWLPVQDSYVGMSVDISDPSNTASYLEASRIVTGSYWSPTYNAEYDAPMTPVDQSTNQRNDAGDLISIQGVRYRKQSINLAHMPLADRDKLWEIVWGNGSTIPIMFSLYPNDTSGKLERTHQIYGKLVTLSPIVTPFYYRYSGMLEIEEV